MMYLPRNIQHHSQKNIISLNDTNKIDVHVQVLDAMFEKRAEPGEYVIRQGDDGDNFYVIENGVFDVLVTGDDRVEKVSHL